MRVLVLCIAILLTTVGCAKKEDPLQRLWGVCQSKAPYGEVVHACHKILAEQGVTRRIRGLVYTQLCANYASVQQWEKALDACERGNDPFTSPSNYNNLGAAELAMGNLARALMYLNYAVDTHDTLFSAARYNRGVVYEKIKNRKAAIADFTQAAKGCGIPWARLKYKALIRFKKL